MRFNDAILHYKDCYCVCDRSSYKSRTTLSELHFFPLHFVDVQLYIVHCTSVHTLRIWKQSNGHWSENICEKLCSRMWEKAVLRVQHELLSHILCEWYSPGNFFFLTASFLLIDTLYSLMFNFLPLLFGSFWWVKMPEERDILKMVESWAHTNRHIFFKKLPVLLSRKLLMPFFRLSWWWFFLHLVWIIYSGVQFNPFCARQLLWVSSPSFDLIFFYYGSTV